MVEYRQKNLNELIFDGQDLTDSIFDRCNVNHCSFKGCNMSNVTFDRCNCIVCDFEDVNMSAINFVKSNIITEEEDNRLNEIQRHSGHTKEN